MNASTSIKPSEGRLRLLFPIIGNSLDKGRKNINT